MWVDPIREKEEEEERRGGLIQQDKFLCYTIANRSRAQNDNFKFSYSHVASYIAGYVPYIHTIKSTQQRKKI